MNPSVEGPAILTRRVSRQPQSSGVKQIINFNFERELRSEACNPHRELYAAMARQTLCRSCRVGAKYERQ